MNQILNTKYNKRKIKKMFEIQFFVSIIFIVLGAIYIIKNIKEKERLNNLSITISLNAKLNSVFSNNEEKKESIYIGKIVCEKIGLDYYVYSEYSEENLKLLPCRFSGGSIGENTNICIIAHNYFDNRFFSNLNKLEIGDKVCLIDLEENLYEYKIYQKYEVSENDMEKVIKQEAQKELTLCTCTYDKEKRLVIRAKI